MRRDGAITCSAAPTSSLGYTIAAGDSEIGFVRGEKYLPTSERWFLPLPLRQRRRGVEGSSIPRSSDEPQWSEGPKCSRRRRVLRFEVDRRLIAQR